MVAVASVVRRGAIKEGIVKAKMITATKKRSEKNICQSHCSFIVFNELSFHAAVTWWSTCVY